MTVTTHLFARSSNLEQAEYDSETQDLTIAFQNGRSYVYRNVSLEVFRRLQHATSAGQYFHRAIKDSYASEEV